MLPVVVAVVTTLAGGWALVLSVRDRPAGRQLLTLLGVLAVVEVALLVQTVAGLVALAGTDRPVHGVTFAGYLFGAVLVLPIGAWWAVTERSRWGPAVLAVACLTVPVLVLRLDQLWAGHA